MSGAIIDRHIKISFKPAGKGEVTVSIDVNPEIRQEVKDALISGDAEALAKITSVEMSQAQVLLDVATVLNDHFARKEGET